MALCCESVVVDRAKLYAAAFEEDVAGAGEVGRNKGSCVVVVVMLLVLNERS